MDVGWWKPTDRWGQTPEVNEWKVCCTDGATCGSRFERLGCLEWAARVSWAKVILRIHFRYVVQWPGSNLNLMTQNRLAALVEMSKADVSPSNVAFERKRENCWRWRSGSKPSTKFFFMSHFGMTCLKTNFKTLFRKITGMTAEWYHVPSVPSAVWS